VSGECDGHAPEALGQERLVHTHAGIVPAGRWSAPMSEPPLPGRRGDSRWAPPVAIIHERGGSPQPREMLSG
jgi:hypothetical protein